MPLDFELVQSSIPVLSSTIRSAVSEVARLLSFVNTLFWGVS
uniref:Uncharacterized protein n=1 Tax=Arundo donax TaxID=35708 RepID=A0A0A9HFD0_ARUDO